MQCKWDSCLYQAMSLKELYNHALKHKTVAPFYCHWENCGMVCHKKARLTAHLLTHIPYRAYTCKICKKSYKREQEMRRHFVSLHLSHQFDMEAICADTSLSCHLQKANKMSIHGLIN